MKEYEFVEASENVINQIYDLEIVHNKYMGADFDPTYIKLTDLYKASALFDELFGKEDASDIIESSTLYDESLRDFIKRQLTDKGVPFITEADVDKYCKAYVFYAMTDSNIPLQFSVNGKTEKFYDYPGLDHNRDNGKITDFVKDKSKSCELNNDIKKLLIPVTAKDKRILADAGIDPSNAKEIQSIFTTWFVSRSEDSFRSLGLIDYLNPVQMKGLVSQFMEDIRQHPVTKEDIDPETVKENIKWYANQIYYAFDRYESQFAIPGRSTFTMDGIYKYGGINEDFFG